jgi:hypothetical protein
VPPEFAERYNGPPLTAASSLLPSADDVSDVQLVIGALEAAQVPPESPDV